MARNYGEVDMKRYHVTLAKGLTVITGPTASKDPIKIAAQAVTEQAAYAGVSVDDVLSNDLSMVQIKVLGPEGKPRFASRHRVRYHLDETKYNGAEAGDLSQDRPEGSLKSPIELKCDQIKNFLLKKNADYGNSALDPVRIFSKADSEEQIRVRIDDKLSRLAGAGEKNFTEDTVMDLVGYLILLMVKMEELK